MNAALDPTAATAAPAPRSLPNDPTVESGPLLVRLCAQLRKDQSNARSFGMIEPHVWERYHRDTESLHGLVRRIAETPALSDSGLRAKALALYALLDDGGGTLCEDAAAPDRLAWSLVRDILAR